MVLKKERWRTGTDAIGIMEAIYNSFLVQAVPCYTIIIVPKLRIIAPTLAFAVRC